MMRQGSAGGLHPVKGRLNGPPWPCSHPNRKTDHESEITGPDLSPGCPPKPGLAAGTLWAFYNRRWWHSTLDCGSRVESE